MQYKTDTSLIFVASSEHTYENLIGISKDDVQIFVNDNFIHVFLQIFDHFMYAQNVYAFMSICFLTEISHLKKNSSGRTRLSLKVTSVLVHLFRAKAFAGVGASILFPISLPGRWVGIIVRLLLFITRMKIATLAGKRRPLKLVEWGSGRRNGGRNKIVSIPYPSFWNLRKLHLKGVKHPADSGSLK